MERPRQPWHSWGMSNKAKTPSTDADMKAKAISRWNNEGGAPASGDVSTRRLKRPRDLRSSRSSSWISPQARSRIVSQRQRKGQGPIGGSARTRREPKSSAALSAKRSLGAPLLRGGRRTSPRRAYVIAVLAPGALKRRQDELRAHIAFGECPFIHSIDKRKRSAAISAREPATVQKASW